MGHFMKNKLNLVWLTFAIAGLGGCATMSGDECLTSDWSTIGYEDGARGYTADRIGKHRKACAKHGVTPDFAAYQSGRDQGLVEYCQPGRGFQIGSRGGQYYGVCNANLEAGFLDGYNAGSHLYTLRSNVNRTNSEIHSRKDELAQIHDSIVATEVAMLSGDATKEELVFLLVEIKELAERKGQIESELDGLIEDRAHHEVELENYERSVADFGY